MALLSLVDELREDAYETLAYLISQGVDVKVISGDHPATVAALVRRLGVEPGRPVDASLVRGDDVTLGEMALQRTVFGRVAPEQKRTLVNALRAAGRTVAMTGDGINDVLALKDADVGIAMGSGAGATKAVAQLVLLDDSFGAVPAVIAEGRRVIANMERVANLFITKTVYATVLAVAVGLARLPFPFLPRHLTLVSTFTIGIPAFVLALAPNAAAARPRFVARVARFAVPAGICAASATYLAYEQALSDDKTSVVEARTLATIVLSALALWILVILVRLGDQRQTWVVPVMAFCVARLPGGAVVAVVLRARCAPAAGAPRGGGVCGAGRHGAGDRLEGDRVAQARASAAAAAGPATEGGLAMMTSTYQVRISLHDVEPEVWRRLLLPSEMTMEQAIWAMLAGMGWEIYHLYDLRLGEVVYGIPDDDGDPSIADDREVLLGNALSVGDELVLSYDYGDGWEHAVVVEDIVDGAKTQPRCLDGANACPPEDCGGPGGYQELLAVLADPGHEDHRQMSEWAGPFDPLAFDPAKATAAVLAAKPPRRRR